MRHDIYPFIVYCKMHPATCQVHWHIQHPDGHTVTRDGYLNAEKAHHQAILHKAQWLREKRDGSIQ